MTAEDDSATDSSTITGEDVTWLNGRSVARAAAFARLAGTALVVVGALGVVAWAWTNVRRQQQLSEITDLMGGFGDDADGGVVSFADRTVSLSERIDAAADTITLLLSAALAVAAGYGVRLVAEYTVARTGGSLTAFDVGDPVPGDPVPGGATAPGTDHGGLTS
jgi:hypothetical protein